MKILLDTHILLWLAEGSHELPRPSRLAIDSAAARDGIVVSAISFWETAMLAAHRRISLSRSVRDWRALVLARPGIVEAPISGDVAIESVDLPGELHSDPADRLLVATARLGGFALGTRDQRLLRYGGAGHVKVVKL